MDILYTLFYFIIAIGLLVSFHEFGHFWVARRTGVKVLRFSVGFGKALFSFQKTSESTEYIISAIPLGGYVKMVDEREGEVKNEDLPFAFNRQPLWARTAIVAAGPLANLLLAIVLYWCVFTIGEVGMRPVIGPVESGTLAAKAGFVEGDVIQTVNNKITPTWSEAMGMIITSAMDAEQGMEIVVDTLSGEQNNRILLIPENARQDPEILFKQLGLKPWSPEIQPVIGKILEGGAAENAGLQTEDIIISADGTPVENWMQWVEVVRNHAGVPIVIKIEREGLLLSLTITPEAEDTEQGQVGKIGAGVKLPEGLRESLMIEYSLPPLAALIAAFDKTLYFSVATLKMMGNMLLGKASVENLSGPISIAQYAGQSAEMGLVHFLKFLALVSISLGVINLLPVPVLDGGHLMFFAIEAIKGSPVSEKIQLFFQQVGIAALLALMGLAVFLDIERLFQ